MKLKKVVLFIVTFVLMGLLSAIASPTAFDTFGEYNNGSTVSSGSLNGGSGWTGAWQGNNAGTQAVTNGVLYCTGSSLANWRYFSSPVAINTNSTTYYFRADMGVNDSVGQEYWGCYLTDNSGNSIARIVLNQNFYTSYIGNDQFSGSTAGYTPDGTVEHLIGEVQWSGSSVSLSVWAISGSNSIPATQNGAGSPTWVQTDSTLPTANNIGGVLMQSYSLAGTATLNNLYFGSNWSDVVSGTGSPPNSPVNLTATGGNANVTLSWTASTGATSYNVKRATVSGGPYTTIASPSTSGYTDNSAVNGTTYYYVVSAVNGNGESANSSQASATPLATAPSAPTNLSAAAGNGQVALTWSVSTGATSYHVKRATVSGGPYTTIASPTSVGYADSGLVNGTTYYYVVSAVNGIGESANSSPVSATPTAGAAATVVETFGEYANGTTISNMNGGSGWADSWQWNKSGAQMASNGMLFCYNPGNSTLGHFSDWRYFSTPVTITPNLSYYFRADMEANDPNDAYFWGFRLTDTSGSLVADLDLEHTWITSFLGGNRFSGFTTGYSMGTTVHVIGACQWNNGTNTTLSVYVYPTGPGVNLPADQALAGQPAWVQTGPPPNVQNIGGVLLDGWTFNPGTTAGISNCYFGTTWAQVVPDAYIPTNPIVWQDADPASSGITAVSDNSLLVSGGQSDPAGGTNLDQVGGVLYTGSHPQYTSVGLSGGPSVTNGPGTLLQVPYTSPSLLAGYTSNYYGGAVKFSADVYIPSGGAFTTGDSIYLLVRYFDKNGYSGPTYYQFDVTTNANLLLHDQWQTISLTTTVPNTNLFVFVQPTLVFNDANQNAPVNVPICYVRNINFSMGQAVVRPILNVHQVGGNLIMSWTGTGFKLQSRSSLGSSSWTDVPGATSSPFTVPILTGSTASFFRLANQ